MRLELGNIFIKDVQFGSPTRVDNSTLYVDADELVATVMDAERLTSITIDVARPGEEVRISPV